MRKETQKQKIYQYVKAHGSISPKQAFPIGITKLSTRISEMIASGEYSVKKTWAECDGTRYMTYSNIRKRRVKA